MRILLLSDIHGETRYLDSLASKAEEVDLILISGDITHLGGRKEAEKLLAAFRNIGKRIYLVPGNCDTLGALGYFKEERVNIHPHAIPWEEYTLLGLGGALPGPLKTPLVFSEEDFRKFLEPFSKESPNNKGTLFLTHEPPYGSLLDRALKVKHVGSRAIREWIDINQPLVCICGHIHESSGIDRIGDTLCVNPGSFSKGRYGLLHLSQEKPEVTLHSLS